MSDRSKPRKQPKPLSPSFSPSPATPKTLTPSRMARRSLLKPILASSLSLFALYSLLHASPSLHPISFSSSSSSSVAAARPPVPKIYVYDLPRKFTYGVVRSYLLARDPGATPPPDDALHYPGHQHSAEWFLFSDLLRPDRRPDSPIRRVSDPADADLFYVPFFSSLSLIVNPIRPANAGAAPERDYSDDAMQEELIEWIEGQEYWRRNRGRDHVFICQDPNALYRVIDRVRNAVLLVSDFGRLRGDQASLVKDVILPYSHRINPYKGDIGIEGRYSLLFFMGNRYRKEVKV